MEHNLLLALKAQPFSIVYETLKEQFPEKNIQVKPNVKLAFNGKEIESIIQKDNKIILTANFSGLYGVDSPLPGYLLTLLSKETQESERLRDFVNWITGHFYIYVYRVRIVYGNSLSKMMSLFPESQHSYNTLDFLRKMTKDLHLPIAYDWVHDWFCLQEEKKYLNRKKVYGALGDTVLLGNKIYIKTGKLCIIVYSQIEEHIHRVYEYIQKQPWEKNIKLIFQEEYVQQKALVLGDKRYLLGQCYGIPQQMLFLRSCRCLATTKN